MAFNILIVDDSETVRSVIAKTLELSRIDLSSLYYAANGRQALDVLRNNRIDLAFTDINMPVMNGIELIESMQRDAMLENTAVVVISSEGSKTRMDELQDRGVRAWLRKPFTPEALRDIVEKLLGIDHDQAWI